MRVAASKPSDGIEAYTVDTDIKGKTLDQVKGMLNDEGIPYEVHEVPGTLKIGSAIDLKSFCKGNRGPTHYFYTNSQYIEATNSPTENIGKAKFTGQGAGETVILHYNMQTDKYCIFVIDFENPVAEKYMLFYDPNGGNGNVYADGSKYAAGETATLKSDGPTHNSVGETPVVFIGWTSAADSKIYDKNDQAPTTIGEVTFAEENATVYAAWGYDANANGKPDCQETKYTVVYDPGIVTDAFNSVKYTFNGLLSGFDTPDAPEVKDTDRYRFLGWEPTLALTVTENVTYIAQWDKVRDVAITANSGVVTYDGNPHTASGFALTVDGVKVEVAADGLVHDRWRAI